MMPQQPAFPYAKDVTFYSFISATSLEPVSEIQKVIKTWLGGQNPYPTINNINFPDGIIRIRYVPHRTGRALTDSSHYYQTTSLIVVWCDSTVALPTYLEATSFFHYVPPKSVLTPPPFPPIILILTKCEANQMRIVTQEDVVIFAGKYNISTIVEISTEHSSNLGTLQHLINEKVFPPISMQRPGSPLPPYLQSEKSLLYIKVEPTSSLQLMPIPTLAQSPYDRCMMPICLQEKNSVIYPCGHFSICYDCAIKIKTCPECSKKIENAVRIFR